MLLDDGSRLDNVNVILRERLGRDDSATSDTRADIDLLLDRLLQSYLRSTRNRRGRGGWGWRVPSLGALGGNIRRGA